MRWLARPLWENIPFPERWPPGGGQTGSGAGRRFCPRCGGEDRRAVAAGNSGGRTGGGTAAALLYAPGPAGQSGEYPEGQAAHRSGQVQRLRIVRSAVPHGQYRSGGCFPGEGYLHQMLCLCEKSVPQGQSFTRTRAICITSTNWKKALPAGQRWKRFCNSLQQALRQRRRAC